MFFRLHVLLLGLVLSGCQLLPTPPDPSAGQLAYIASDGNIYVTTPTNLSRKIPITTDATAPPEGDGYSYHRISWSPQGELALAGVNRGINAVSSAVFVADVPGQTAPRLVAKNEQNFVIYLHWAPQACTGGPNCRQLAYLIREPDRNIGLYLLDMQNGTTTKTRIGVGRPFYFSWGPDASQIVWHTGGARRFNEAARISVYNIDEAEKKDTRLEPGLFLAPAWSPQGSHWLGVQASGRTDQLAVIEESRRQQTLVQAKDNQIAFIWSPQGDQIAYAIRKSSSDPLFGPVQILNLKTGQTRQVTPDVFRIFAFFWSPDGSRLAYLQQPTAGQDWLQWRVYDLAENQDRGFSMFLPSYKMLYVLGSFNQYAQSHRFWSPDGRYLVYADRNAQLQQRVWLVDTTNLSNKKPIFVAEGTFGVWSWQ